MFLNVCSKMFSEKQNITKTPDLLTEANEAFAMLEKDMPIIIQVIIHTVATYVASYVCKINVHMYIATEMLICI